MHPYMHIHAFVVCSINVIYDGLWTRCQCSDVRNMLVCVCVCVCVCVYMCHVGAFSTGCVLVTDLFSYQAKYYMYSSIVCSMYVYHVMTNSFFFFQSSLTSIPLMFIIPSLIYLKLTSEKGRVAMVNKILSVVILFSGFGLTLLGTGVGIYRVVTDSTGSQLNPLYCSDNQGSVDVCPIEGFRNLSSSSVAAFWGCDCNAIFEHNHPQLCQNRSMSYI